jgi:hypothetical protein
MGILFAKASVLFGRIQEQTSYIADTSSSSVLIDTAYAGNDINSVKTYSAEVKTSVNDNVNLPQDNGLPSASLAVQDTDPYGSNVDKNGQHRCKSSK